MKDVVNNFRTQPLHNKVLGVVYLLIALALPFIICMKPAHARSGKVYAVPPPGTGVTVEKSEPFRGVGDQGRRVFQG